MKLNGEGGLVFHGQFCWVSPSVFLLLHGIYRSSVRSFGREREGNKRLHGERESGGKGRREKEWRVV